MSMSPELRKMLAVAYDDAHQQGAMTERAEILHAYLTMTEEDFQSWLYDRSETMLHQIMREVTP